MNDNRSNFMKSYKFFAATILLMFLCDLPLFGMNSKYTGEFLKIGLGVREMSLGGATVASAQPVSSVYWNPALLYGNQTFSGQIMHTEEFAGVLNLDHLSLVLPRKGEYAYGFGFFRLGVDDIPDTRNALIDVGSDGIGPGHPDYSGPDADGSESNGKLDDGERLDFGEIGSFGSSENALFFSVAKSLKSQIIVGGTVKGIYKSLGDSRCWGVGFDVAALYPWKANLVFGLSLNDISTTFLFWGDGEKELILPSLRGGVSWTFVPQGIPFVLRPSAGLDMVFEGEQNDTDLQLGFLNVRSRLGLEIQFKDFLMLRAGRDDLGSYHVGCGIDTPLGSIDYGFAMGGAYRILGESHRLGLTIHFAEFGRGLRRWL